MDSKIIETVGKMRTYIHTHNSYSAIDLAFNKVYQENIYEGRDIGFSFFELCIDAVLCPLMGTHCHELEFPICKFMIPNAGVARWLADSFTIIAGILERDSRDKKYQFIDVNADINKENKINIIVNKFFE